MTIIILPGGLRHDDSKLRPSADVSFGEHLVSLGTAIPVSSALGANVTSVVPAGNDRVGILTIVASGVLARATSIATLTFGLAYSTTPRILLSNETSGNLGLIDFYVLSQATGVSFQLASDQALAAGTYVCAYLVEG